MKSSTNRSFWEAYHELPASVRREARKTYRLWLSNPLLRFTFHIGDARRCGRHARWRLA